MERPIIGLSAVFSPENLSIGLDIIHRSIGTGCRHAAHRGHASVAANLGRLIVGSSGGLVYVCARFCRFSPIVSF
jgi:hypothetical protein